MIKKTKFYRKSKLVAYWYHLTKDGMCYQLGIESLRTLLVVVNFGKYCRNSFLFDLREKIIWKSLVFKLPLKKHILIVYHWNEIFGILGDRKPMCVTFLPLAMMKYTIDCFNRNHLIIWEPFRRRWEELQLFILRSW